MTDKLTGSAFIERSFIYLSTLARDCRKNLMLKFEREHKGIPFNSVETVLKKEVESWFMTRDKNISIDFSKSMIGKSGEILLIYSGATKDVHFKVQVDGRFTLGDTASDAPAYIKNLNIKIDKRDITK
ncbi:MAG: hypothetical protein V1915_04095 [Candidatus Bathyarchaeota archaeon]